jgi:hypothetical protein
MIHLLQMLQSKTGGMGFHVFTGRFYTSPQLALELHKMKIHTTGTAMTSRKDFTTVLRRTKLGNHEYCFYQKDMKIICLSFQD